MAGWGFKSGSVGRGIRFLANGQKSLDFQHKIRRVPCGARFFS